MEKTALNTNINPGKKPGAFNGIKGLLEPAHGEKPEYEQTKQYYREKRYLDAIECAKKTIEKCPTFAPAYVFIGKCFAKLGKNDEAEKALRKAIETSPESTMGYLELIRLKILNREYYEAREIAIKNLAKHPKNALVHLQMGVCEFRLENYESAIYYFLKSLEFGLYKESPHNFIMRAYVYCGKIEFAIMHYNEENRVNPHKVGDTASFLASTFLKVKKYEEAVKYYNIAISLKSDEGYFYNERGRAYLFLRKYSEAIENFEVAAKLMPKNPYPFKNIGTAFYWTNNYSQARKFLEKSAQIRKDSDTLMYLAKTCIRGGNRSAFEKFSNEAIMLEKNPKKKEKYISEKEYCISTIDAHDVREGLRHTLLNKVKRNRRDIGFVVKGK